MLESQMTVLRSEFETEEEEIRKRMAEVEARDKAATDLRSRIAHSRKADEDKGR
jgi:hypothetical protein